MTNYAQIIARTNANGEFEFMAHQYREPDHRYYLKGNLPIEQYDEAMKEWDDSCQIFKAASEIELSKIKVKTAWKHIHFKLDYCQCVDVTEFVVLKRVVNESNPSPGNYFIFYNHTFQGDEDEV